MPVPYLDICRLALAGKQKEPEQGAKELSPAECEIESKLTRFQAREDADPMTICLHSAICEFPYVAVVRRADIESIQIDEKRQGVTIRTRSRSDLFLVSSVPPLQKLCLGKGPQPRLGSPSQACRSRAGSVHVL